MQQLLPALETWRSLVSGFGPVLALSKVFLWLCHLSLAFSGSAPAFDRRMRLCPWNGRLGLCTFSTGTWWRRSFAAPLSCWLPLSLPVQQVKKYARTPGTDCSHRVYLHNCLFECVRLGLVDFRADPGSASLTASAQSFQVPGLAGRSIVGIDSVHVGHAVFPYFPFFSHAHSFGN